MTREKKLEELRALGGVLDRQIATAIALGEDPNEKGLYQYNVSYADCTCAECPEVKTCKCAWDPYNTNGDCLAGK